MTMMRSVEFSLALRTADFPLSFKFRVAARDLNCCLRSRSPLVNLFGIRNMPRLSCERGIQNSTTQKSFFMRVKNRFRCSLNCCLQQLQRYDYGNDTAVYDEGLGWLWQKVEIEIKMKIPIVVELPDNIRPSPKPYTTAYFSFSQMNEMKLNKFMIFVRSTHFHAFHNKTQFRKVRGGRTERAEG